MSKVKVPHYRILNDELLKRKRYYILWLQTPRNKVSLWRILSNIYSTSAGWVLEAPCLLEVARGNTLVPGCRTRYSSLIMPYLLQMRIWSPAMFVSAGWALTSTFLRWWSTSWTDTIGTVGAETSPQISSFAMGNFELPHAWEGRSGCQNWW